MGDWHAAFYMKTCQAKLRDILEDGYVPPDPAEGDIRRDLKSKMTTSIRIIY